MSLVTTLTAVACSQFDKLRAVILDIRQENVTLQLGQEDGHGNPIPICILQSKLNVCIRLHQDIMT